MFKINNKGVFIVKFKHMSHLILVLLLLTLSTTLFTDWGGPMMLQIPTHYAQDYTCFLNYNSTILDFSRENRKLNF